MARKKRLDSKGYTLRTGESQNKDGRYCYKWMEGNQSVQGYLDFSEGIFNRYVFRFSPGARSDPRKAPTHIIACRICSTVFSVPCMSQLGYMEPSDFFSLKYPKSSATTKG